MGNPRWFTAILLAAALAGCSAAESSEGSRESGEMAAAEAAAETAAPATANPDAEQIRDVIASAYIDGLHKNGDRADIRAGFHPSFVMKVLRDGEISDVAIEDWIGRLPPEGEVSDREVTHTVPNVDIAGRAAVARVEVEVNGEPVFTDFMSLYRFDEGWRIVAKIFNAE